VIKLKILQATIVFEEVIKHM